MTTEQAGPGLEELPVTLDEALFVLSRMQVTVPFAADATSKEAPTYPDIEEGNREQEKQGLSRREKENRKHLRLLNGLALLLVTEAYHDVVAVSMLQKSEAGKMKTTFVCAKNRAFKPEEVAYIKSLVNICNSANSSFDTLLEQLKDAAFPACQNKIQARASKVSSVARNDLPSGATFNHPVLDEATSVEMRNFRALFEADDVQAASWDKFLRAWVTSRISKETFSPSSPLAFKKLVLAEACHFVQSEVLMKCLPLTKLQRKLKKLAMFEEAVVRISNLVISNRGKHHYAVEFVTPPPPPQISKMESPLSIVNRCVAIMGPDMDPFSVHDLETANADLTPELITNGQDPRKAALHCECVLASHIASKFAPQATLQIGLSKRCCFPCWAFIQACTQGGLSIVVSGSHGKNYPGWGFPTSSISRSVHEKLQQEARRRLGKWLQMLHGRRVSDSHADSDSRGEKERMKETRKSVLKAREKYSEYIKKGFIAKCQGSGI